MGAADELRARIAARKQAGGGSVAGPSMGDIQTSRAPRSAEVESAPAGAAEPARYYDPATGQNTGRIVDDQADAQSDANGPAPKKQFRNEAPSQKNLSVVGMKSTPEDRKNAIIELHKNDNLQNIYDDRDNGALTAELGDGRVITYPSPSTGGITIPQWLGGDGKTEHLKGLVPNDTQELHGEMGRMGVSTGTQVGAAMTGASIGGLASGGNPAAAAMGGYLGNIGGAIADPWVREGINAGAPGGSTQSTLSKVGESVAGAAGATLIPYVGGKLLGLARGGVNRAASKLGVETAKAGLKTSSQWLAEAAEARAARAAGKAANALGVSKSPSPEMADHLDAASKAGVATSELPPSAALLDSKAVGPGAHERVAQSLKNDVIGKAEREGRAAVSAGAHDYGKRAIRTADEAEFKVQQAKQSLYDEGQAHPEVKARVDERQGLGREPADNQRRAQINRELDEAANGPAQAPRNAAPDGPAGPGDPGDEWHAPRNDPQAVRRYERAPDGSRVEKTPAEGSPKPGPREDKTNARGSAPAEQPPAPPKDGDDWDEFHADEELTQTPGHKQDSTDVPKWARGEVEDHTPPIPSREDKTSARGSGPKTNVPADEDASVSLNPDDVHAEPADLGAAARKQRAGDALHRASKDKNWASARSYEGYKDALRENAPALANKAKEVYQGRLLKGKQADQVLGKLSQGRQDAIGRIMGEDGDDLVKIDKLAKAINSNKLPHPERNDIGAFGAMAHAGLAVKLGLGKAAAKAKSFFGNQKALNKVMADPKLRAHLLHLIAEGRKADPTDYHAARSLLTGIHALGDDSGHSEVVSKWLKSEKPADE
jgi:hypothetical protein